MRTEENGSTWLETWTVDKEGRPDKILSKQAVEYGTRNAEGKTLMREFVAPDGTRTSQIVDPATGKVIAENRTGGVRGLKTTRAPDDVLPPDNRPGPPIPSPRVPAVEDPVLIAPSLESNFRNTREPLESKGGQQLDLISLATSYADAVSERETATIKLIDVTKLGDSKVISQQEVGVAKLALAAAQRKEKLLRSIAQVALDSAAQDVEIAKSMHQSGRATLSAATDAMARLSILKEILGTSSGDDSAPKK